MSGWKQQQKIALMQKQLNDFVKLNGGKPVGGGKSGVGPKDAKGGKAGRTGKGAAAKGGAATVLVCTCCGKNGSHKTQDCNFQHEACDHCGKYGHRSRCWYSPSALAAAAAAGSKAGGKGAAAAAAAAGGKGLQAKAPAAAAAAATATMICNCCGEAGHKKPECPHKLETCGICGKVGHLPPTCSKRDKKAAAGPGVDAAGQQRACTPCWFCPDVACDTPQYNDSAMKCTVCWTKRVGKDPTPPTPKTPKTPQQKPIHAVLL